MKVLCTSSLEPSFPVEKSHSALMTERRMCWVPSIFNDSAEIGSLSAVLIETYLATDVPMKGAPAYKGFEPSPGTDRSHDRT